MSTHKRVVRRTLITVAHAAVRWISSFDPFGPYSPDPARR